MNAEVADLWRRTMGLRVFHYLVDTLLAYGTLPSHTRGCSSVG